MRRASTKVLFHLKTLKPSSFALFSKDLSITATTTAAGDGSHSPATPPKTHIKYCSKTRSLLFSSPKNHLFQGFLSQNFNTLVDPDGQNQPQMSSRQRKIKQRSQIEEAFEAAESTEEMLKAFEDMEACFDEREMAMACLKMGLKLDQEGEDPEKALDFAQRALKAFDDNDNSNVVSSQSYLPLAMTLQLLGSVCYSLKRFNDGLGYLTRANRLLSNLEKDGSCSSDDIMPIMYAVHSELFNIKTAMGRREEALVHLRKALEFKELTLEGDSRELGKAYRDVADAYFAVLNFGEALGFCLKALEIHKSQLGNNSLEVAYDRRLLAGIYTGLEQHEKALEQNQLSQKILKQWGQNSELLQIDAANMHIASGRYEEAIDILKGVVQQIDKEGEDRAMVFVSMAKALFNQENFADSKKCLEIACGILGKKERTSPQFVAEEYMEISVQYESMNEFEIAISLLKRALGMLEKLPHEQHSVGNVSARIGWLLLLTGKVDEAISYLEDAAERLKETFGSKHYAVGYVYNNLGAAYLELGRPQSAAQAFAYAKDIMDVALGPHHADTIEACQNLSKAYDAMGSYSLAINFQEKVVEAWEGHGPSARDETEEAVRVLEQLKEKAHSVASESTVKALPS